MEYLPYINREVLLLDDWHLDIVGLSRILEFRVALKCKYSLGVL